MKQTAHGWLTFNFVFGIIESIFLFINGLVLFFMGLSYMASATDTKAAAFLLLFYGLILIFWGAMIIVGIVISKKAQAALGSKDMPIALGVLCIIFGSLPVGGILYLCYRNKVINGVNLAELEGNKEN